MPEPSTQNLIIAAVGHHQAGRLAQAEQLYRQVLSRDASNADALHLLGVIAHQVGKHTEAIRLIERAVAVNPKEAGYRVNLSSAYHAVGELEKAVDHARQAIAIEPRLAEAHNNLARTYKSMGLLDEAIASFRSALAINPGMRQEHSNLLLALNYHPKYSAETIFAEHVAWAQRHAAGVPVYSQHANVRDPNRKLRVGYVSPDFKQHAVTYFIESILEHHDRSQFEVTCYSDVKQPDVVTKRLEGRPDRWRSIAGMNDAQAAEVIRADGIDILVDLAGHTAEGRLLLFARKPAPAQIAYLGYPNTTGLSTIDYRITDALADPPGVTERFYEEKLLRLDGCFLCYRPPENAPEVNDLPATRNGYVTFGSFNNFAKVTEEALRVWGGIVASVPSSRLLLKARGITQPSLAARLHAVLGSCGVSPERIELSAGQSEYRDHLAMYHKVDIALDTWPYNGTTTTLEAMHMGVPVVTKAGTMHAGRVGVSILTNTGLSELIAEDDQQYTKIATSLVGDLQSLAQMRVELRGKLGASAMCDGVGFTRKLEAAYRSAWAAWCAT